MDVDSIEPGLDFTSILKNQVASCEILLALIGQSWLSASDDEGRRRLANPNDFVRIEIANGLAHGKRVIPVLVGAASMPRAEDLPEELKPLAQRQAVRLTHENFNADVERLIKVLSNALTAAEVEAQHKAEEDRNDMSTSDRETAGFERRRGIPGWLWGAQALIVLALLGYWFFRNLTEQVVMQPQVTQLVSPAARSVEVTPAVPSTPARLVVNNIAGKVHYDGTVGDEQTRSSIIAAVQRVFGEENASGTITIDPAVDPANWLPKLEAVLQNFKIPGAEMLLQGNRIGLGGAIPQGDIELLKQALVSLLGEGGNRSQIRRHRSRRKRLAVLPTPGSCEPDRRNSIAAPKSGQALKKSGARGRKRLVKRQGAPVSPPRNANWRSRRRPNAS
jgi:hypothetical protein